MPTEAVGELVEPTGMTVFLVPSTSSGTAYKVNAVALRMHEIEQAPPESFLFQSGYLTFKEKDPEMGYLLGYPNRECGTASPALFWKALIRSKTRGTDFWHWPRFGSAQGHGIPCPYG